MSPRIDLPPLNGLRAFEAAGRYLTFRAAAEELGVTPGAVAQQVRGLEDRLGLRLFLRQPRGLALTDIGRSYHLAISRAFGQIADATAGLLPAPARVTISVTPTFASKWLIPRLPEFTRAHPDIDLRIMATERVASFHADGIDLAVRLANPPFGASLRADLLFRQDIIAICAPALVADQRLPLDAGALLRLTFLHDTHDLWPVFVRTAFGIGELSVKSLHFNQTTLSLDAALAGQGIALASRFLVKRDLDAGRLVQPVRTALKGAQDFHLLAPRQDLSRSALETRDWLIGAATADGA